MTQVKSVPTMGTVKPQCSTSYGGKGLGKGLLYRPQQQAAPSISAAPKMVYPHCPINASAAKKVRYDEDDDDLEITGMSRYSLSFECMCV